MRSTESDLAHPPPRCENRAGDGGWRDRISTKRSPMTGSGAVEGACGLVGARASWAQQSPRAPRRLLRIDRELGGLHGGSVLVGRLLSLRGLRNGVAPIIAGALQFCANADAAPSAPGAYILQIDLAETVLVTIAGKPPTRAASGTLPIIAVLPMGREGSESRLARHMRHGKSVRWHIDQLTERGAVIGSWIVRNGRECDLVAMLAPLPMPIPGSWQQ